MKSNREKEEGRSLIESVGGVIVSIFRYVCGQPHPDRVWAYRSVGRHSMIDFFKDLN